MREFNLIISIAQLYTCTPSFINMYPRITRNCTQALQSFLGLMGIIILLQQHHGRRDVQEDNKENNNTIAIQNEQQQQVMTEATSTCEICVEEPLSLETNNIAIQDQQQQVMTTTCEICIEPLSPENFFNYSNDNQCNHPFCTECISKYIGAQIEGNKNGMIRCPAWKCKQMLDPMLCRSIIPEQLFHQWCDALCFSALLEVQGRCYCPYEGCKELIINECGGGESVRKVKCPKCKKFLCFKCKVPWHEGNNSTCESHRDALFLKLARRQRWRACPTCGQWIERVSGCETIHCRCGRWFRHTSGERIPYRSPCVNRNVSSNRIRNVSTERKQVSRGICKCWICVVLLLILAVIIISLGILYKILYKAHGH